MLFYAKFVLVSRVCICEHMNSNTSNKSSNQHPCCASDVAFLSLSRQLLF